MSEIPVCTIVISSQISASEIASLEMPLELNEIKLQKSTERIVGADDIVFIATVMDGFLMTLILQKYYEAVRATLVRAVAELTKEPIR